MDLNKSMQVYNTLQHSKLIALLSPASIEACIEAYEVFKPLNIVLEIAARTDAALAGIEALLKKYPDALVLGGTIVSENQVLRLAEMGIAGIISPDYIPAVLEASVQNDLLYAPGGLYGVGTQLAHKAAILGISLEELRTSHPYQYVHKLFPAYTETADFTGLAKAWFGPYKNLQIMYTGGVNLARIPQLKAGDPGGIFCGSALTRMAGNPGQMEIVAREWISAVQR